MKESNVKALEYVMSELRVMDAYLRSISESSETESAARHIKAAAEEIELAVSREKSNKTDWNGACRRDYRGYVILEERGGRWSVWSMDDFMERRESGKARVGGLCAAIDFINRNLDE